MIKRKSFHFVFPEFQRRLLLGVLVCSGTSVILSTCVTAVSLSSLAGSLPNDGDLVMNQMGGLLSRNMAIALGIGLPAFLLIAGLISMPLMGVCYRLRSFLEGTANGSESQACALRENDPMQDLAELLNRATEAQREKNGAQAESDRDAA